jgi:hypothetical protein
MNEMLLFLSMMFHTFAMRLVNTIPSPDFTKLVTASAPSSLRTIVSNLSHSQVGVQHAAPDAVCRVFHVFRLPG